MTTSYEPKPEHKFTFGLWTVGNIGRDPFGGPVREQKTPAELVRLLGEVGAYGVNFHDNDTCYQQHSLRPVLLCSWRE